MCFPVPIGALSMACMVFAIAVMPLAATMLKRGVFHVLYTLVSGHLCVVCILCSLPVLIAFPSCACWGPVYGSYGFGIAGCPALAFRGRML
jgi:hypothetical protein